MVISLTGCIIRFCVAHSRFRVVGFFYLLLLFYLITTIIFVFTLTSISMRVRLLVNRWPRQLASITSRLAKIRAISTFIIVGTNHDALVCSSQYNGPQILLSQGTRRLFICAAVRVLSFFFNKKKEILLR